MSNAEVRSIGRQLQRSIRRQIIGGILSFITMTSLLIYFDSFEHFYDFSRSHESWELDEWVLGVLAALFTSALTFGLITLRFNMALRQEMEYQLRLEQQLAQAQKMQSLGTLAGGIAHSTNNYLQPIQTLSRLSKKKLPEGDPLQPVMDKILVAAERAQQVQEQLLRFSHKDKRGQEGCDFQLELAEHKELFMAAVRYPANLSFKLTDQPCPVTLAPSECADILLALITNAEDSYLQGQGPIEVSLDCEDAHLLLTVRDRGCGMSEEVQQRIFEPFYTSKGVGEGTGLGLSIVHGLITLAGGSIVLESAVGEGSCFKIKLPLTAENA